MDSESIIGLVIMAALWLFNNMRKKQGSNPSPGVESEPVEQYFEENRMDDELIFEPIVVEEPPVSEAPKSFTRKPYGKSKEEKILDSIKREENRALSLKEQEDSEESDFEFDAREAIIYSEIMNRPYR